MLLGMAEVDYLSGFVGACLIQYFYRKRTSTAFAILRRLLTVVVVVVCYISFLLVFFDELPLFLPLTYLGMYVCLSVICLSVCSVSDLEN